MVKLSTLLVVLGALLAATARGRPLKDIYKRTISQIYQDHKAGNLRPSLFTKIIAPVSLLLIVAGIYLSLTSR